MLSPYRVLDLSGKLGFLAGRILGDLGADVIKVEPPGGSPDRMVPPFVDGSPHPERSLYWMAYNNNKRGVTLDIASARGRELLLEAVRRSDFLVESFPPGYLQQLALDYPQLHAENPRLIMVSVTPFGQDGPYREHRASDLEILALSGALSLAGEPDEAPVRVSSPQSYLWAGAEAAMGALIALYHRQARGRGQHVDVSAQMASMSMLAHAPAFWDVLGVNPTRAGIYMTGRNIHGARMRVFWQVRDGWINFILYGGAAGMRTNQALVEWMDGEMGAPEFLKHKDWRAFDVSRATQEEIDEIESALAGFFARLTKAEFLEGVTRRAMLGYPVSTAEDILGDPQLQARQFWRPVRHPGLEREMTLPGPFAWFSRTPMGVPRPAPGVGEHNREFWGNDLGIAAETLDGLQAEGII